MPPPYAAAPQQDQGGLSGALSRQIGPLKAWQWGVAVGGAILLYKYVTGGFSGGGTSTGVNVPFTNVPAPGDNTADGSGIVPAPSPTPTPAPSPPGFGIVPPLPDFKTTPIVKQMPAPVQQFQYFWATRLGSQTKAPLYSRQNKLLGYTNLKTLLLGPAVKFANGQWYYPVLNMPGKYIHIGKYWALHKSYSPPPGVATSTPVGTVQVASPTTTSASNPTFAAQLQTQGFVTTIDNAKQIFSPGLPAPSTTG